MTRPNVLLISIDTLRADHLSCYGYHRATTPNLDQLASEGVVYEQAYSTAGWTPPAHGSMLTGVYPSCHGAIDNNRLSPDVRTLAEIFSRSGYRTAGFVNNPQVGALVGLQKGHDTFVEVWKGIRHKSVFRRGSSYLVKTTRGLLGVSDHGADRTNRLATRWIQESRDQSFYLFIHYIEAHNPFNAPYPFKYRYWQAKRGHDSITKRVDAAAENPLICFTDNIRLTDDELDVLKALYDGEVSYVDHKIGQLLLFLKQYNIYDNTLIIATSDHGEHFGEHDLYSHVASLYEPIVHVPLIMKYPKALNKRGTISELVQLIDIYPTLVDAAGLSEHFLKGIQGTSLFDTETSVKYHRSIMAEWEGRVPIFVRNRLKDSHSSPLLDTFRQPMVMMREGNYKYIWRANAEGELYDLFNDPSEVHNIVGANPEIACRLRRQLAQWRSSAGETHYLQQSVVDEVTRRNLESLGYL